MNNWAYAALPLNNEEAGIGTIYYGAEYFKGTDLTNPVTVQPYTDDEIKTIVDGASENNDKYIEAPEGAAIGMGVFGADDIIWFDAENAKKIVSHTDPLGLNKDTKTTLDKDGNEVAKAL